MRDTSDVPHTDLPGDGGRPAGQPGGRDDRAGRVVPGSPLTDADRWPLLDDAGRAVLVRLREHPHRPRFNHVCGDRLDADGLATVEAFGALARRDPPGWSDPAGAEPAWLAPFVERVHRVVPAYRRRGPAPDSFTEVPPTTRDDLATEVWSYVPDDVDLAGLCVYSTSGTNGPPVTVPSCGPAAAGYLALHRAALARWGVHLEGGAGRVGVVNVGFQRSTWTYAAVSTYLGFAGGAKVNLHPGDWRDPADRRRFLDDLDPELYTGDPVSLAELAALGLGRRPKAVLSTATTLLPATRAALAGAFGCPVIDRYGLTECGPVAYALPDDVSSAEVTGTPRHTILHPRLMVEVLDPDGRRLPPGVRGEVTLTGGHNPMLPLLRYRTGDHAALVFDEGRPVLVGLEGRAPVTLRSLAGAPVNSLDVSQALRRVALARYQVHQRRDGSVRVTCTPTAAGPAHPVIVDEVEAAVTSALGGVVVEVVIDEGLSPATVPFTAESP